MKSDKASFITLNERWQFMPRNLPQPPLLSPFISKYLERFTLHNRCCYIKSSENHKPVEKTRWRISDASLLFPSSFNRNYERSKGVGVDRFPAVILTATCRTYNMKFADVTEPKREFDKYPQVKLLILAEGVLVMADRLQRGHGVKTQH